jgi:steroid delta-isomerase-like uncharacterized protein
MEQATAAQTIDTAWAEEFVERWAAAWNSHDPERLFDLMTDDIVYDDSAWPETMRGKPAVREFLDYTWRAFPDMEFEGVGGALVASDGPRAAFWWRGTATHSGPIDPPGIPATGRRVEFEGADFHDYRDGKLARLRIVFDMASVMRQLGALPDTGAREERLVVALANLRGKLRRRG